jgi:hypothetical protein
MAKMAGTSVVVGELEYEIGEGDLKILRGTTNKHIESVVIPADVCVIGEKCFHDCELLREVTFETGSRLQRIEK